MASLKDSFSKGITALNVKTNNFMEENKCKTYITTLENEIRDIKLQIGDLVYQKWTEGETYSESVEPFFGQIKEKYAEIERQKQRIAQLQVEEKQILGSQSAAPAQPAAPAQSAAPAQPVQGNKVFCSQCGAPNDAAYKFCSKCGAPMNM